MMESFLQRMVQRFHDQVFQDMSPERRARKIAVMKTLARESFKYTNKENESPNNNNMALTRNYSHSTPLKNKKITDLDTMGSDTDIEFEESEVNFKAETENRTNKNQFSIQEPELVVAKIYDLVPIRRGSVSESLPDNYMEKENRETDIFVSGSEDDNDRTNIEKEESHWTSLEVLDETAEQEFCKSLEASKLFVSTSSLLEEIEADLPSSYSLLRPFNHTFHTLTTYRTVTRLARVDGNVTCPNALEQRESLEVPFTSKREDYLEMEAKVQKACMAQAEKALILSKTQKLMGLEYLESEKTFLLANLRYNAAIRELGKLKMLGEISEKDNFGQITISDIYYTLENLVENSSGYFLCTATEKEKVQSSCILDKWTEGKLHFTDTFKFQDLGRDFVIYIELFKLHLKEPKMTILTTSLMKKLKKIATTNLNKSISDSQTSITNFGFTCVACAELRFQHVKDREDEKGSICINQTPIHPLVENTLSISLQTDLNIKFTRKGFLNVFKHTWHRRWYFQSGYFLVSWLYPEDQENDEPPIDSIYVPDALEVKPAGFEVCVRPNSFLINFGENNEKILFSADSNKEMMKWIDHLNLIIENIKLWKPNV